MIRIAAHAISDIVEAKNKPELHTALQSGIERLGFATYNLSCHKQSQQEFMLRPTLTSWSEADLAVYDFGRWYERDPLLAYAATDEIPRAWKATEWLGSPIFDDYGTYLIGLGIRAGVTAPLANRPGAISAITTLTFTSDYVPEAVANAIYVIGHAGMMRAEVIGLVDAIRDYRPADIPRLAELSKEQLEILEWVAKGKSNQDIATITNRSRRVVAYHVSEILRKLDVSTRAQAASVLGATPIRASSR